MGFYRECGLHTLIVSEGLSQRLLLTELKGITACEIPMPAEAVYVAIPESLGFEIHNDLTGKHSIYGAYVVRTPADEELQGWRILLYGHAHANELSGDDSFAFNFLPGDSDISEAVIAMVERGSSTALNIADLETRRLDQHAQAQVVSWLANVFVYMSSEFAEVNEGDASPERTKLVERLSDAKSKSKAAKLKQRLRLLKPRPRTFLGASLKVDKTLPFSVRDVFKPSVRVLVRAHWRRYWVGVGRTKRVTKWIEPHWRGEDISNR